MTHPPPHPACGPIFPKLMESCLEPLSHNQFIVSCELYLFANTKTWMLSPWLMALQFLYCPLLAAFLNPFAPNCPCHHCYFCFFRASPKSPATRRKRDCVEEVLARAKAKGYKRGVYREEDAVQNCDKTYRQGPKKTKTQCWTAMWSARELFIKAAIVIVNLADLGIN